MWTTVPRADALGAAPRDFRWPGGIRDIWPLPIMCASGHLHWPRRRVRRKRALGRLWRDHKIPRSGVMHPLDGGQGFATIRDPLQIRLRRPSLTSEQLERREDAPSSRTSHDRGEMAACKCRQKRSVTALRLDILREAKNEVNGQFHSQSPNPEAARPKGEANGCPRLPG